MARGLDRLKQRLLGSTAILRIHSEQRGAAVVETAFTLVLLVMLLLGTVTAGIAFGQSNALQTAAREGARFGATLPDAGSKIAEIEDVTEKAATGALDSGVPGRMICAAVVESDSDPDRCFTDGRPEGEWRVQVAVERSATINAVVFSTDITLREEAVARYERAP